MKRRYILIARRLQYWKSHPCNMKEFKIFVGNSSGHMMEVLHAGLKNDSIPETFPIKYINSVGVCFPTRYVKIVPLSAHGHNFHTSIWYVRLGGVNNEGLVAQVRSTYDEHRETVILRQVLKHLRQRRLFTPFQSISLRSGLQLEHPLITQLYDCIVLRGEWAKAEDMLQRIADNGLYDAYLRSLSPHASWTRLDGGDGDAPSPRGGHAMCLDPINEIIYLFGGWDGQKNLDDFWAYDVKANRWKLLCHSTSAIQNAPGARSCHKMAFDTKTGSIYVLGRLSDADSALLGQVSPEPARTNAVPLQNAFCSEFYRYHTRDLDEGKWDFLSFDTAAVDGPRLIFDHQMVMDCEAQILYVFGGRIVDGEWDSVKYSGLYSYDVRLSKWRLLQSLDNPPAHCVAVPGRFGHSMVFIPSPRTLLIFGGQKDETYLSDMYAYDLETNTTTELFSNFSMSGGPDPCFTQRAVVDPQLKEVYLFYGLTRSSAVTLASDAPCWLYRYDTQPGEWTQILPAVNQAQEEPLPRYAHQVAYSSKTATVYLHGGNAGLSSDNDHSSSEESNARSSLKEQRLDDFWQMRLMRPGPEDIIRRSKFKIRQQRFREMCEDSPPLKALNYLQTEVASVVDHNDLGETNAFRSLLDHLLEASPDLSSENWLQETQMTEGQIDTEERWTNQLYVNESANASTTTQLAPRRSVSLHALMSVADPLEQGIEGKHVSAERFEQRNEVFEKLLEFVARDAKQPLGNLLDMIADEVGS
ncbi:hypothetical protein AX16_002101 [Volvariella volvacea WC 439]|nr:hypothetical protein AX16_002101 [Volvariella volvacea WC 439]